MTGKTILNSTLNSYSQIFFSDNRLFAVILIVVSFIDYQAGLAGLISVITMIVFSNILSLNELETSKGLYGFNSLLVGLGLGNYFALSPQLILIIIIASFLTLMLVNLFKGLLQKYYLPYLSLPFIFSLWMVLLASKYFPALGISERGIFTFNTLYNLGGTKLVNIYESIINIPIPFPLKTYFISLAAIFFQYTAISGILIAIGLLIFSRIAFLLSVGGFFVAFYFYQALGGDIAQLSYSYIGFNFILTAIAVGGFFLIPSVRAWAWTLLLIPVVILITISLAGLFSIFQLSVYSLPFNIVVLLFLYTLKFRTIPSDKLTDYFFQYNSPEKNLYSFLNQKTKAYQRYLTHFKPPFHGKWTISQSHDGEFTHKDDWKHAWDFVITDDKGRQYKNGGIFPEDYYCFGKSVLSPADGTIVEIVDHIPDNPIGEFNLVKNWGNTVVIKHDEYLFSSLSHLKSGTICVKQGDSVKQGQKIGEAGNSGRSPWPHLHMQFQATPYIGSKTIYYPISYYMLYESDKKFLKSYNSPQKDQIISTVELSETLVNAWKFIPGKQFSVSGTLNNTPFNQKWEIFTDTFNNSYIFNHDDNSAAWFHNNGTQIYFTYFKGNRNSVLYYFYLSSFNVYLTYYDGLKINDELPPDLTFRGPVLWLQDIFAPFFLFLKTNYSLNYEEKQITNFVKDYNLTSLVTKRIFSKKIFEFNTRIFISDNKIKSFTVDSKKFSLNAEIN